MAKYHDFEYAFTPIRVGNRVLKNRFVYAPMVSALSTPTGGVSDTLRGFVEQSAKTGAAVVTIGSTPIDKIDSIDYFGALDVTSDDCMVDLLKLSEVVHRHDALINVELVHAGRSAPARFRTVPEAIAPTPIPVEGGDTHVREMNYDDMERVKREYCEVADRLARCDFDMVMIHAAHGNLLAQFLSPRFNHRVDQYGGTQENRFRYPLEVLAAVREVVGDRMLIDMRISGDELIDGGMRIDETIEFIKQAQQYIDTVHVSQGLIVEPRWMPYTMPAVYLPHMHNVPFSQAVKNCPDIHIPVCVVGSITTVEEAEEIIASGKADMVAMCRQLMADPDVLSNARHGHSERTRPCLRCHQCAPARITSMRCAINPFVGREDELGEVQPARYGKRAVVVGGGIAGCMAAKTLAWRGHDVILLEESDRLGGKLEPISSLSFKPDMRAHLDWLRRSTEESGVDIRYGTTGTVANVMALEPDVVYVATGSHPLIPNMPGIDKDYVVPVLDLENGLAQAGQRVVVCGDGSSGMECALNLAMQGKDVTLVGMRPIEQFACDLSPAPHNMLFQLLDEYGVELIADHKVVAFTDEGVEIESRDWEHRILSADTAVVAFGERSNNQLYFDLLEEMPDVYAIGDANKIGNIMAANQSAFNKALLA